MPTVHTSTDDLPPILVMLYDESIEPDATVAPEGQVRFTVMNRGSRPHDFLVASAPEAPGEECAEIDGAAVFRAAGIAPSTAIAIEGLEDSTEFYGTHMGGTRIEMDVDLLRREVVDIAVRFARAHPDMAAMVLECTTLPTFAADIQAATGLPVVDYVGFMDFVHRSVVQRRYDGFV